MALEINASESARVALNAVLRAAMPSGDVRIGARDSVTTVKKYVEPRLERRLLGME